MKYIEALNLFEGPAICIVVCTDMGIIPLTEHNFGGGLCGCCKGFEAKNTLTVKRVVDMESMDILYLDNTIED